MHNKGFAEYNPMNKSNILKKIHARAKPMLLGLALVYSASGAQAQEMEVRNSLADLSLEELLSTEITTLSRKPESIGSAPAAVHVISQSDIRRSGARTIPELLRLVPGMQVAQIDGNKWAVTSRGANGRFANKLLVLMDGRTLYNPMLSGVQWDVQDTDIAAIERIEVIRGPGATMWGSNAVNGIVNIITKHAAETQGGNVAVLGGQQGYEGVVRYGTEFNSSAVRFYGKFFDRDGNVNLLGEDTDDYSEMWRIGSRFDWDGNNGDELTLSFELYDGESGEYRISRSLEPPYTTLVDDYTDISGGFAMASWSRTLDNQSTLAIRAYYDTHDRDVPTYSEEIETIDLDMQYGFSWGENHNLMVGAGYRHSSDETTESFEISIRPIDSTRERISAFVQDEITLWDGKVRLMLGSKFENNDYGDKDIEVEPSARLSVAVADNQTWWASVSKAVRMPSRGEQGGRVVGEVLPPGQPQLPLPVPTVALIIGNPQMVPEDVIAYEMGYRVRSAEFQLDVAMFYNDFSNLRSLQQGIPVCAPSGVILPLDPTCVATASHVEAPLIINNESSYDASGLELSLSRQMSESWRLQGNYTYFHASDDALPQGQQELGVVEDSPDHQVAMGSSTDIGENLEFDLWLRWVDELEAQGVDAYTALDLRFAWTPVPTLSVAAVARNLLAGDHLEFMSELVDIAPVQIESEAFIELRWTF